MERVPGAARPTAHYARRLGSATDHIVTNVVDWYSGMTHTTECGVKRADVREENADRDHPKATACKRCLKILGWDLPRVPRLVPAQPPAPRPVRVQVEMTEQDFDALTRAGGEWDASTDWEVVADAERFVDLHADLYDEDRPRPHDDRWTTIYWLGGEWTTVMFAKAFLKAQGESFETGWDMQGFDGEKGEHVLWTNYRTPFWGPGEPLH